jgi:hypothetical protein
VSSIGSVADRKEMPSDFRCDRSAKWSYFSRANRVRLKTTTKWTLPLCVRQYLRSRCSGGRSAVFALSPSSLNRSRIDERADGVHLSYDPMASFLAPYGSQTALAVARDLDAKIEGLLETAAR